MTNMESEKLRRLYDIYEQPMYRIAYAVLKDENTAEDAVSEAFLRIIKHINRIDEPDSPRTKKYIIKIIRSTSIEQYRKKKHFFNREAPIDEETMQLPDKNTDIEREVIGRQPSELLEGLTDEERNIVEIRCIKGKSWKETAQELSISEAAARKRFERIRKRLIKSSKGECDDEKYESSLKKGMG